LPTRWWLCGFGTTLWPANDGETKPANDGETGSVRRGMGPVTVAFFDSKHSTAHWFPREEFLRRWRELRQQQATQLTMCVPPWAEEASTRMRRKSHRTIVAIQKVLVVRWVKAAAGGTWVDRSVWLLLDDRLAAVLTLSSFKRINSDTNGDVYRREISTTRAQMTDCGAPKRSRHGRLGR
jgi:hypothetical protein